MNLGILCSIVEPVVIVVFKEHYLGQSDKHLGTYRFCCWHKYHVDAGRVLALKSIISSLSGLVVNEKWKRVRLEGGFPCGLTLLFGWQDKRLMCEKSVQIFTLKQVEQENSCRIPDCSEVGISEFVFLSSELQSVPVNSEVGTRKCMKI